jgi:lantibiotic modifying enzyme
VGHDAALTELSATEYMKLIMDIAGAYDLPPPAGQRMLNASGWLGGAVLLNAHLQRATPDAARERRLRQLLGIIEQTAFSASSIGLYSGLTGFGWLLAHTHEVLGPQWEYDLLELDRAVLSRLSRPWSDHFDLISGVTGVGVYGLKRLPSPEGRDIVSRVLRVLEERASAQDRGTAWFTPSHFVPQRQLVDYPEGCFDLGMAHGGAGVVAFLARAAQADIERERAIWLLDGAVPYLLSHLVRTPKGWALPARHRDVVQGPRLAWCYNELGAAVGILQAARCRNNPQWLERAREVLISCAAEAGNTGPRDVSFCHGAVGVAYLFGLSGQLLAEPCLVEAASRWRARIALFRDAESEPLGFYNIEWPPGSPSPTKGPAYGLLEGVGAVGLVLLAHIQHDAVPAWSGFFGYESAF